MIARRLRRPCWPRSRTAGGCGRPRRPPRHRRRPGLPGIASSYPNDDDARAAQPPLRPARSPTAGGKTVTTTLPREDWIAFIPGYITLDQHEANLARLAVNAAAHGPDPAAGPPREGPALLQGIIICGRCGNRMTIRYHTRDGKELPTYVCQRDGIASARLWGARSLHGL